MVAVALGLRRVAVMVSVVSASDSVRWMTGLSLESVTDKVTSATLVAVWAAVGSTLNGKGEPGERAGHHCQSCQRKQPGSSPPPPIVMSSRKAFLTIVRTNDTIIDNIPVILGDSRLWEAERR